MLEFRYKDKLFTVNEFGEVRTGNGEHTPFTEEMESLFDAEYLHHVPFVTILERAAERKGYAFAIMADDLDPVGSDVEDDRLTQDTD
tara:strand:- start:368 stop:628 length:261 start_codon:yes stop_codon:yes gene_type:complete